jgi:hypothetical protein
MRRKLTIKVWVETPPFASEEDIAEFIADSLSWAGGCRHPEDPLFSSLKVSAVQIGKRRYENNDAAEVEA